MHPADIYSPFRLLHQFESLQALRDHGFTAPTSVQLSICDSCHHSCVHCGYRTPGLPQSERFFGRGTIRAATAVQLMAEFARMGVRSVEITGGGEPLLHPRAAEIFLAAIDCDIRLGLITNGTLLDSEHLAVLRRAAWVRVSLDAGTPETYAAVHQVDPSDFARALSAVEHLATAGPLVGVSVVVQPANWREIPQAITVAQERGASYIRVAAQFSPNGVDLYDATQRRQISNLIAEATAAAAGGILVLDQFGQRCADLAAGQPTSPLCLRPCLCPYVAPDLTVYRCCATAYSSAGRLGSLADQTWREMWEGNQIRDRIRDFNARDCPRCPFRLQNALAEAIGTPAANAEFL